MNQPSFSDIFMIVLKVLLAIVLLAFLGGAIYLLIDVLRSS